VLAAQRDVDPAHRTLLDDQTPCKLDVSGPATTPISNHSESDPGDHSDILSGINNC
jgi:hypothetical protein